MKLLDRLWYSRAFHAVIFLIFGLVVGYSFGLHEGRSWACTPGGNSSSGGPGGNSSTGPQK